jgi:hypothetical protein
MAVPACARGRAGCGMAVPVCPSLTPLRSQIDTQRANKVSVSSYLDLYHADLNG